MSTLDTHVLDTSLGRPAGGVAVVAVRQRGTARRGTHRRRWQDRAEFGGQLNPGTYHLRFDSGVTSPRAAPMGSTPRCW